MMSKHSSIDSVFNVNIRSQEVLITPYALKKELPVAEAALKHVQQFRQSISDIIQHKDKRLLVICGPCSIHDVKAAREYALRLKALHDELGEHLFIVMRVYFEKPRTTIGWKGLINDPNLDGSFQIEQGLRKACKLLIELAEMGLPMGTEALDPISPQYLSEFFSWSAIGARTTESQTHRELASGLSMPVGFKNGTNGSVSTAIDALKAATSGHRFMGINQLGQVTVVKTAGNSDGHIILRGGDETNYDAKSVALCEDKMQHGGVKRALMIDCSHSNSDKDYRRQAVVAQNVMQQITAGNRSIIGIMLESNLHQGNQPMVFPADDLKYGVSITDACIDWETTETLLRRLSDELSPVLKKRLI